MLLSIERVYKVTLLSIKSLLKNIMFLKKNSDTSQILPL